MIEDPKKSRTEERMDKLTVRLMKLKPDVMLILRNQHTIMTVLRELLIEANPAAMGQVIPLLRYQINQTDEAISKGRVKDD